MANDDRTRGGQLADRAKARRPAISKEIETSPPRDAHTHNAVGGALDAAPSLPHVCDAVPPTPKTIEFFHAFTPPTATAQTRRHNRAGASYLPPAAKRAAALLLAVFERHAPKEPFCGPLDVGLYWTYPCGQTRQEQPVPRPRRPDLDNLAKLALDAATKAGYWHDDAQVTRLETAKFDGPLPGIAFRVAAMAQREGGR